MDYTLAYLSVVQGQAPRMTQPSVNYCLEYAVVKEFINHVLKNGMDYKSSLEYTAKSCTYRNLPLGGDMTLSTPLRVTQMDRLDIL